MLSNSMPNKIEAASTKEKNHVLFVSMFPTEAPRRNYLHSSAPGVRAASSTGGAQHYYPPYGATGVASASQGTAGVATDPAGIVHAIGVITNAVTRAADFARSCKWPVYCPPPPPPPPPPPKKKKQMNENCPH